MSNHTNLSTRITQLFNDGIIDAETAMGFESAIADAAKWEEFHINWRDMETAPRNNSRVEVKDRHDNICVAYFDRNFGGGKWIAVDERGLFMQSLITSSLKAWRPLSKERAT